MRYEELIAILADAQGTMPPDVFKEFSSKLTPQLEEALLEKLSSMNPDQDVDANTLLYAFDLAWLKAVNGDLAKACILAERIEPTARAKGVHWYYDLLFRMACIYGRQGQREKSQEILARAKQEARKIMEDDSVPRDVWRDRARVIAYLPQL